MMRRPILPFLLLALVPATAPAQASVTEAKSERPLGIFHELIGNWEGQAWFQQPDGTRHEVNQTERVEAVAGGTAIAVHGLGTERLADGTTRTVHDAFAVVFRDRDGAAMMRAFIATGQWSDAALTMTASGYEWHLTPAPNVTVRYVMWRDAEGRWVEKGYQKYADQPEREFFGMTLTKR